MTSQFGATGKPLLRDAVRISLALSGQTAITQGGISILDAGEDWEDAGRFVTKCKAQLRKGGITFRQGNLLMLIGWIIGRRRFIILAVFILVRRRKACCRNPEYPKRGLII